MADGLTMSLDDIIAKRQGEAKSQRKERPAKPAGSGKASAPKQQRAPAPRKPSGQDGHDDRTRAPAAAGSGNRGGAGASGSQRLGTKRVAVLGIGEMTAATLQEVFTQGGLRVVRVDIENTPRGQRIGVVTFLRFEEAEKAVAEYDRALVDGREIKVKAYEDKSKDARAREGGDRGLLSRGAGAGAAGGDSSIVVKKPSNKVHVQNLPFDLSSDELAGIFRECGRILDSRMMRGHGFVDFQSVEGAKQAIKEFDGAEVNGRVIEVSYAK